MAWQLPHDLNSVGWCLQEGGRCNIGGEARGICAGEAVRGLGVAIPELKMREGMVAPVDSPEWTDSGPEATEEG